MHIDGDGTMPARATKGSAGYDFYPPTEMDLVPGEEYFINTNVRFDGTEKVYVNGRPADNWFLALYPRSSYGKKFSMRLLNTTGIIDRDFRDPIQIMVTVGKPCHLTPDKPFAQGILMEYGIFSGEIEPETEREGGIGSTDRKSA